MNFAQFHATVTRIAKGRYCSSQVEITTSSSGETTVEFKVYLDGDGWHSGHTPELALQSLAVGQQSGTVEELGELPAPTVKTDESVREPGKVIDAEFPEVDEPPTAHIVDFGAALARAEDDIPC